MRLPGSQNVLAGWPQASAEAVITPERPQSSGTRELASDASAVESEEAGSLGTGEEAPAWAEQREPEANQTVPVLPASSSVHSTAPAPTPAKEAEAASVNLQGDPTTELMQAVQKAIQAVQAVQLAASSKTSAALGPGTTAAALAPASGVLPDLAPVLAQALPSKPVQAPKKKARTVKKKKYKLRGLDLSEAGERTESGMLYMRLSLRKGTVRRKGQVAVEGTGWETESPQRSGSGKPERSGGTDAGLSLSWAAPRYDVDSLSLEDSGEADAQDGTPARADGAQTQTENDAVESREEQEGSTGTGSTLGTKEGGAADAGPEAEEEIGKGKAGWLRRRSLGEDAREGPPPPMSALARRRQNIWQEAHARDNTQQTLKFDREPLGPAPVVDGGDAVYVLTIFLLPALASQAG